MFANIILLLQTLAQLAPLLHREISTNPTFANNLANSSTPQTTLTLLGGLGQKMDSGNAPTSI